MNKNLVICPTLDRPDQLTKMVKSFYMTQTCSDLIILTAIGSITTLINSVDVSKYQYVTITNDDFEFKTFDWDRLLIKSMKKPGFAYGFDGVNTKLPTTCMIDIRIVKALGWIQLPELEHLCGDMVWSHIGQKLNNIYFNKNVSITHNHFLYNKAEKDAVYEKTNSREMYQSDNEAFRAWVRGRANDDIERVRLALL